MPLLQTFYYMHECPMCTHDGRRQQRRAPISLVSTARSGSSGNRQSMTRASADDALEERRMRLKMLAVGAMGILLGGAVWSPGPIGAQIPPERLRFRLVGDEPIATADARAIVTGFKVLVFRDTGSNLCYVSFITGSSMAATGPVACP
jgi:hypothetical protein